jgi:hypothetical protein
MVQQSAPDWLRDYADKNRLFHCTEVSIPHLVVLDAYTKVLPSGVSTGGLFQTPNLGWRIRRTEYDAIAGCEKSDIAAKVAAGASDRGRTAGRAERIDIKYLPFGLTRSPWSARTILLG